MLFYGEEATMFFFVAILSVVSAVFFLTADVDFKWKLVTAAVVAASLAMQFIPVFRVHFMIPFLMQLAVCLGVSIHWRTG